MPDFEKEIDQSMHCRRLPRRPFARAPPSPERAHGRVVRHNAVELTRRAVAAVDNYLAGGWSRNSIINCGVCTPMYSLTVRR